MTDTLDCGRVEQALAEMLSRRDDATPEPMDARVAAHVEGCAHCRAYAARTKELLGTLMEQPVPDPGRDYWRRFPARVRARVEASSTGGRSSWTRWSVGSGLAAAAVLALVLIRLPGIDNGGEMTLPTADPVAALEGAVTANGGELDNALDELLGGPGLFEVTDEIDDLDEAEQRALLDTLRAELKDATSGPVTGIRRSDPDRLPATLNSTTNGKAV